LYRIGRLGGQQGDKRLAIDGRAQPLTCTGGTAQSAAVTVNAPAPTVTLSASPTTVASGSETISRTHSAGNLTAATKFTLACTGAGGSASQSATTYSVTDLTAGTWYFAVAVDAAEGTQSAKSNIGSKTF
jgi:hypothetical protein